MENSINILLVDDHLDGLISIETILSNPRYKVIKAKSLAETVQLASQCEFALILLDLQTLVMDGFEAALKIKNMPECRYTPLIFVTAIDKVEVDVFRAKVAFFVDLFEKFKKMEEDQALRIKDNSQDERYLRLAQLEVESLHRYRNLANSIPHAVWRSRPDGTMDYFNRGWCSYTGLSDQQSQGMGWQIAIHPDDLRLFLKAWRISLDHVEDFEIESRIQNAAGEMRWNFIKVVAETRTSGEILAWLGTCTDIHDRKIGEEKLAKAEQEADAANSAKTNFLANMSHEIRTPLNSILGFTELMMSPHSLEDQIKNLATIKKNGNSLLKIVDEILDISKVETGLLEIEEEETDLNLLLLDIYTLLEVQAQEKTLSFNFKCTTPIPAKIITDPTRYRQILVNIIGNSLKFTKTGKVELEISWHADAGNSSLGLLRCYIIDTGIGIDNSDAKNLFQPFVQGDSSKSRRFGGTGLGLALSFRLAKALNGTTYIKESKPNVGTTFLVEIKVKTATNSHFIERLNLDIKESVPVPVHFKNTLQKKKILVVDDSSDNRNLISQFLVAAGAEVDCARDGIEGVRKALAKDYEVILMDIQMPLLDGYQATAQLREKGYVRPIIALTAHALKQEKINSINAGCDDHLTKPIDRRTLIDQVARHLKIDYGQEKIPLRIEV